MKVPAPSVLEFTVTTEPEAEHEFVAVGDVKFVMLGVELRVTPIGLLVADWPLTVQVVFLR